MISDMDERDIAEIISVSKSDGFEHPNVLTYDWIKLRIEQGDKFYVFKEGGKILGFLCFQPNFSRGSRIHFLSVLQEEQHKGIGTSLVSKAEELTKKLGRNKLYLYVHQKNKLAIKFYMKMGFEFSGIFLDKYGNGEHALLMCKIL